MTDLNRLRELAQNSQVSDDNRITTLTVGELRAALLPLLDENDRLREALRGVALYEDSDGASCWCNANPDQVHVEWCVAARAALESSGGSE